MQLKTIRENGVTWLALDGRLDLEGTQKIEAQLTELTAGRGKNAIVDVTGVTFIGSLAVGLLFKLARALRARHARLILLGPKASVLKVLETTYVTQLLDVADDEASAKALAGIDERAKPLR